MKEASQKLLSLVEAAEPRLHEISGSESIQPILPDGWSRKQSLGISLIQPQTTTNDSFAPLFQRPWISPGTTRAGRLRVQAVPGADWQLLVALRAAYNRYRAHVIAHLPDSKLETVCRIGRGNAVTVGFLATVYLTHLIHHLSQLGATESN